MSIDEWAKLVVEDIMLETDERAPVDAILLQHLDAFEEIAQRTRLKIPAFARALTRAGLTLKSGKPYSPETLRAQISRARAKRGRPIPDTQYRTMPSSVETKQLVTVVKREDTGQPGATSRDEEVLARLARLKPRRAAPFTSEE